jgi:uridine phosphorylase
MAIGIGQGNMEIAMIEIAQIVKKPRIIRCGTSSGLQKKIGLGDLVIAHDVHSILETLLPIMQSTKKR